MKHRKRKNRKQARELKRLQPDVVPDVVLPQPDKADTGKET